MSLSQQLKNHPDLWEAWLAVRYAEQCLMHLQSVGMTQKVMMKDYREKLIPEEVVPSQPADALSNLLGLSNSCSRLEEGRASVRTIARSLATVRDRLDIDSLLSEPARELDPRRFWRFPMMPHSAVTSRPSAAELTVDLLEVASKELTGGPIEQARDVMFAGMPDPKPMSWRSDMGRACRIALGECGPGDHRRFIESYAEAPPDAYWENCEIFERIGDSGEFRTAVEKIDIDLSCRRIRFVLEGLDLSRLHSELVKEFTRVVDRRERDEAGATGGATIAEGPAATPPRSFDWQRRRYTGIRPQAWRLIEHLLSCKDWTAEFSTLAVPVWCDHAMTIDRAAIGSPRKYANDFFRKNSLPFKVSVSGEYVFLKQESK